MSAPAKPAKKRVKDPDDIDSEAPVKAPKEPRRMIKPPPVIQKKPKQPTAVAAAQPVKPSQPTKKPTKKPAPAPVPEPEPEDEEEASEEDDEEEEASEEEEEEEAEDVESSEGDNDPETYGTLETPEPPKKATPASPSTQGDLVETVGSNMKVNVLSFTVIGFMHTLTSLSGNRLLVKSCGDGPFRLNAILQSEKKMKIPLVFCDATFRPLFKMKANSEDLVGTLSEFTLRRKNLTGFAGPGSYLLWFFVGTDPPAVKFGLDRMRRGDCWVLTDESGLVTSCGSGAEPPPAFAGDLTLRSVSPPVLNYTLLIV